MLTNVEITQRREGLRMQRKELAKLAPCSETTLWHIEAGLGCRTDTLKRLEAALIAQELAMRDYLVALHPIEASAAEAAA